MAQCTVLEETIYGKNVIGQYLIGNRFFSITDTSVEFPSYPDEGSDIYTYDGGGKGFNATQENLAAYLYFSGEVPYNFRKDFFNEINSLALFHGNFRGAYDDMSNNAYYYGAFALRRGPDTDSTPTYLDQNNGIIDLSTLSEEDKTIDILVHKTPLYSLCRIDGGGEGFDICQTIERQQNMQKESHDYLHGRGLIMSLSSSNSEFMFNPSGTRVTFLFYSKGFEGVDFMPTPNFDDFGYQELENKLTK